MKYKCRVCGGDIYEDALLLKNVPASAQDMPSKEELENDYPIDMELVECKRCGLLQLTGEPVDYYRNVIRATGLSTTFQNIRRKEYKELIEKYNLQGKRIVEFGCGKGENLEILKEFPVRAFGIENNEEFVEICREKGLDVSRGFAENGEYRISEELFDGFICFNFLEHQPYPNDFLQAIYNNLKEGAVGIITVPDFEYVINNSTYFYLTRDHILNFTEDTMRFALVSNGFEILYSGKVNEDNIEMIVKKKEKMNLTGFINDSNQLKEEINHYIDSIESSRKIAVWGASHYAFAVIQLSEIYDKLTCIIDSAKFKQGRFSPASHVPIVSPDEAEDYGIGTIIIMAPGYIKEIAASIREKFGEKMQIFAVDGKSIKNLSKEKDW